MSKVVIQQHKPWRTVVWAIALAAGVAALCAGYFIQRQIELQAEITKMRSELVRQKALVARRNAELEKLNRTVTRHERSRQVEQKGYARVERDLAGVQSRILGLEEEVAFYRSIVASSEQDGVRVRKLFLFPGSEANRFRYQVVLTRHMKDDKVSSGSLSFTVSGESDGKARSIPADDLLGDGELEFSFKHFHRLEGQFDLPPEFVPRRVHVRVKSGRGKRAGTEKAFDWVVTTG